MEVEFELVDRVDPLCKLSAKEESRLFRNKRELSAVEGNLLSQYKDVRDIYVTSSFNREGKTTCALQLAYAMTLSGHFKVLLVDMNTQAPCLHDMFQLPLSPGMMDFFLSDAPLQPLVHRTEYQNLFLMTHGAMRGEGSSPLRGSTLHEKLELLRGGFDFVVCDGTSVMGASDASVAANIFSGVVIVLECEKTKWEVLQMVVEKMKDTGARVLGVVLNKRKFYIPRFLYGKI